MEQLNQISDDIKMVNDVMKDLKIPINCLIDEYQDDTTQKIKFSGSSNFDYEKYFADNSDFIDSLRNVKKFML
jgi:antitoxin component of RelBE/YafQ-DinJ toxin-antitoxin module